ncbi:MAG: fatty acid desaturase [Acetobacteraceae bacterium]
MHTLPDTREIRRALVPYAVASTPRGLALFAGDVVLYLAALAGVLFSPWGWLQGLASVFAGIKVVNLVTLGHEASHQSLTASRRLNHWLAIAAFTPGLFNYRLWLYDHHNLHHHNTNECHPDSYTPLTLAQYRALGRWGRFKQRLYRSRSLLVFGLYYIAERWWHAKFFPRARMPVHVQRQAWPHFWYLLAYLASFLALLLAAPLYSPTSSLMAVGLGFCVPFYVFQSLFAFSVYVQHTHPRVPWFVAKPDRQREGRQELISVHLQFPYWFSLLAHHAYDHAAHHVHPAIPSYRIRAAQARLNALLGPAAISDRFSLAWLFDVQRRCKLYDFERHQWLDFDGRPTAEPSSVVPPGLGQEHAVTA